MAIQGISTSRLCEGSASCLAGQGLGFVFRYHSRTTALAEKRLRPREAAELARAGLAIAAVYQDRARQTEDFGAARGRLDGAGAFSAAGQVGQPQGSAIYFAVDVDFSAAQIAQFVLPYFRGVREALAAAAGGGPGYRVGVYGSGLTCRLLDEAGLVDFKWLAQAGGWRESRSYQGWDVKQGFADRDLCALGRAWESCEAKGDFGQFRPVGFELRAGEGTPMRVAATALNLRFVPSAVGNTPMATLPHATRVWVLGDSGGGWVRVRTVLDGATFIGHVKAAHLEAEAAPVRPAGPSAPSAPAPTAPAAPAVPAVHWLENNPQARRNGTSALASPIGEAGRPTRDAAAPAPTRVRRLTDIGDWLDVERSARYARRGGVTFCNVYAADYCYLAGAYLPRVWWTGDAIAQWGAGRPVEAAYGRTVREMRADDLCRWLQDFGASFGWRRVADATALQDAANGGGLGLICADRLRAGLPGHITVVVPENGEQRATRDADGNVDQPLQSQAGGVNRRYGSAGRHWWLGSEFVDRVFYVHD